MLSTSGFGDEKRILVNSVLERRAVAGVTVDADPGRRRATLVVISWRLAGRDGRRQHVGWDEQRPGEALRSV
jgi:hypothetical protein